MSERLYIVVSGPPGSGKSTLARPVAQHFGLPLLAKDTIKEAMMSLALPVDVEASRDQGRAAVAVLYAVAADAPRGAVLESVFYRPRATVDLRELPGRIVEVFCRCEREVAVARYRSRAGTRHDGHFDRERTDDELWHAEVVVPVAGGWPVLEVDTNGPVDRPGLMAEIGRVVDTTG